MSKTPISFESFIYNLNIFKNFENFIEFIPSAQDLTEKSLNSFRFIKILNIHEEYRKYILNWLRKFQHSVLNYVFAYVFE